MANALDFRTGAFRLRDEVMPKQNHSPACPRDPRWHVLSLVQTAREALGLRDRDIAVLRGLLSFILPERWDGKTLMVFASNRVLQERCDGMDERTLRRRLAHLCQIGLIQRHQSPNRKRYSLRTEHGDVLLSYGFDLVPLREAVLRLETLAAEQEQHKRDLRLLRALLRDRIYHLQQQDSARTDVAQWLPLLRNKVTLEAVKAAIQAAEELQTTGFTQSECVETRPQMTVNDGQNDRHIQSSNKEYINESLAFKDSQNEIGLQDCLEACTAALDYAPHPIRSWTQLHQLAEILGPAIGIRPNSYRDGVSLMGQHGTTLAVLGLLQAANRIRSPQSYFAQLLNQARGRVLNLTHMFRSLTKSFTSFRPETRLAA